MHELHRAVQDIQIELAELGRNLYSITADLESTPPAVCYTFVLSCEQHGIHEVEIHQEFYSESEEDCTTLAKRIVDQAP